MTLEQNIILKIGVQARRTYDSNQYVQSTSMTLQDLQDLLDTDPDTIKTKVTEMINRTLEAYGEEV